MRPSRKSGRLWAERGESHLKRTRNPFAQSAGDAVERPRQHPPPSAHAHGPPGPTGAGYRIRSASLVPIRNPAGKTNPISLEATP